MRHDAVAWGYAREADRRGVEIHQKTAVTGIDVLDGEVVGVSTSRGTIRTRRVRCATGNEEFAYLSNTWNKWKLVKTDLISDTFTLTMDLPEGAIWQC